MKQEFAFLLSSVPDLLSYKTLLYIGIRPGWRPGSLTAHHVLKFFRAGYIVDILEIWPPHIEYIRKWNEKHKKFRNIIEGDAEYLNRVVKEKYDVVMFWHGPEHLKRENFGIVLEKMCCAAKRLVIVGCPLGEYKQSKVMGNPYDRHLSSFYPDDFTSLGWNVLAVVKDNVYGEGNIMAWFRKEAT